MTCKRINLIFSKSLVKVFIMFFSCLLPLNYFVLLKMQSSRQGAVFMQQKPQQPAPPNVPPEQTEPIVKVKKLLPLLKEALINLMQVGSQNVAVSIAIDDMQKGVDASTVPSFNKCLEQFYTLCDQLEVQLNLAYQQLSQGLISAQYTPLVASTNFKVDPKGPQLYSGYLTTVEQQMKYAKDLHDLLSSCVKKLP